MGWFSTWFAVAEADVLAVIADVKSGVAVLETDLQKINSWVVSNAPTIASDIASVLSVVGTMSTYGALPASVLTAAKAAEDAAAGIAAYVAATKVGSTTETAVIAGYTAIKQAAAAHSATAIAISTAPVK